MTAAPLPDSWDDEPWPLDDPTPAPSLRPTNWSDTHDQPPQVADLADEAWQYAIDHGISMERALVELQDRALYATGGPVSAGGSFVLHPGHQNFTVHFIQPADPQAPTPDDPAVAGVDLTKFIAWDDPDASRWFNFSSADHLRDDDPDQDDDA